MPFGVGPGTTVSVVVPGAMPFEAVDSPLKRDGLRSMHSGLWSSAFGMEPRCQL